MKRLPFERQYLLESERCDTCGSSGRYSLEHVCLNCRGMGRRITSAGRKLFYEIAELLGKPVLEHESRIQPDHFETITGERVRIGMRIGELLPGRIPKPPLRCVKQLERRELSLVITFSDGYAWPYADTTTFTRELTDNEIGQAENLMAEHLGEGAVLNEPVAKAQELQ